MSPEIVYTGVIRVANETLERFDRFVWTLETFPDCPIRVMYRHMTKHIALLSFPNITSTFGTRAFDRFVTSSSMCSGILLDKHHGRVSVTSWRYEPKSIPRLEVFATIGVVTNELSCLMRCPFWYRIFQEPNLSWLPRTITRGTFRHAGISIVRVTKRISAALLSTARRLAEDAALFHGVDGLQGISGSKWDE